MKIVADENIPLLREFFAGFGTLTTCPGRGLSPADVADADVLLVRSVTRVGPELLRDSRVRFVGTATIGTDHLDLPWLAQAGIHVASAPGCNARAVAEYVVAALLELCAAPPAGQVLGVIGLGNVGSQVARLAAVLGWQVIGCDPFVQRVGIRQLPLTGLLAGADVVSLHTPLTRSGPHATWHLLGAAELDLLKPGAILLNSGRGPVVDNAALLARLAAGRLRAVLDVWEGEPTLLPGLIERVALGSPHIAGYSLDGKWRGTQQVYEALCQHLGQPAARRHEDFVPAQAGPAVSLPAQGGYWESLRSAVRQAYDIRRDDLALRQVQSQVSPPAGFDELRRHYPARREFPAHRLILPAGHIARSALATLGFQLLESS